MSRLELNDPTRLLELEENRCNCRTSPIAMPINPPSKPNSSEMQAVTSPQAGTAAPDFTTQNTTGKTVHLKDFRGKKLVLYFYPRMILQAARSNPAGSGINTRKSVNLAHH